MGGADGKNSTTIKKNSNSKVGSFDKRYSRA